MSSRANLPPRHDGHLSLSHANRDLEQKLTYQQLLNLNHDLTKQNQQLKNISERLGQQLRNLHTQFDIKPREENSQLYHAIGNHPVLHNYEQALTPLLEAYEEKIQNFQHHFQTIYEEFVMLQKKFESVCRENQDLKMKLTDKIKETIELYKNNSSQKLKSDFGKLIMEQVHEKQKLLLDDNKRLEGEYQKHKIQSEKNQRNYIETKARLEDCLSKLHTLQTKNVSLDGECTSLKEKCFNNQLESNNIKAQKNKIDQALERSNSQINQLIKQRNFYMKKHEDYKSKFENNAIYADNIQEQQSRQIKDLQNKLQLMRAEQLPNSDLQKLNKITKESQDMVKSNQKLKQSLEQNQTKIHSYLNQIKDLNQKCSKLESHITQLQISESKLKKSVQSLNIRLKTQGQNIRRQQSQVRNELQSEFNEKLLKKQKIIDSLQDKYEHIQLQKDKLEKENVVLKSSTTKNIPTTQSRDAAKIYEQLNQQLKITENLFSQQIDIFRKQNQELKKQNFLLKQQSAKANDQNNRIKHQLQQSRNSVGRINAQKQNLTQNIKKVRDEYEVELRQKQRAFHQRIEQVRKMVEDSDKKRKQQRQKVQEISRKYQNAVDQLKRMYQENSSMARDDKAPKMVY